MSLALTPDPLRLGLAAVLALIWSVISLRKARPRPHPPQGAGGQVILYASQSGLAEALAQRLANRMGMQAQPLDATAPRALAQMRKAWFLISTTGEGDAPDNARAFAAAMGQGSPDLGGLRYGLLALGDRQYPAFCGFGRALDDWLADCGATPLFPRIEVDRAAPADLARWDDALGLVDELAGGQGGLWRLEGRETLSPGPEGAFHLTLSPQGHPPAWQPGAIADVALCAPDGSPQRRSYSVASLAESGRVELIVRGRIGAGGVAGLGSGWLTQGLPMGGTLRMTLRDNPAFGRVAPDVPLVLIATGTGLAGVLAHLRGHLVQAGAAPVWLLHGTRHGVWPLLADMPARPGLRIDTALSRGPDPQRLPQLLLTRADDLRAAIAAGAAVLVCGGRAPGAAILETLGQILGPDALRRLTETARLRCDLY